MEKGAPLLAGHGGGGEVYVRSHHVRGRMEVHVRMFVQAHVDRCLSAHELWKGGREGVVGASAPSVCRAHIAYAHAGSIARMRLRVCTYVR